MNKGFELAIDKSLSYGAPYTNALNDSYAKGGLQPDDVIVRFVSLENFWHMVESHSNVLARVSTWQDVYEGFVLRLPYLDCDVAHTLKGFYGQCWTKRMSDSEVLWNARCPSGYGVCLKSTVAKLAKSIVAQCSSEEEIAGIGRLDAVEYEEEPDGSPFAQFDMAKVRGVFSCHATLLDSFFRKRYEFNDECEVRVILDLPQDAHKDVMQRSYRGALLSYGFDRPEDFIDEVMFHPAMQPDLCECLKCLLQKKGWDKVKIGRSRLYDLPRATLKLFEE